MVLGFYCRGKLNPARMSKLKSFSPAVLLVEFISITFAVFLGFLLTEWRTDRSNAAMAEGALQAIASETAFNQQQVEGRVAYFRAINAQFDSLRATGQAVSLDKVTGWTGAAPPLLRRSAYDAAMATGALGHAEFKVTNDIATMYAMQGYMETFIEATMVQLMDREAVTAESIEYIFQVFIDISPEVVRFYREVGMGHLAPYGYEDPAD